MRNNQRGTNEFEMVNENNSIRVNTSYSRKF